MSSRPRGVSKVRPWVAALMATKEEHSSPITHRHWSNFMFRTAHSARPSLHVINQTWNDYCQLWCGIYRYRPYCIGKIRDSMASPKIPATWCISRLININSSKLHTTTMGGNQGTKSDRVRRCERKKWSQHPKPRPKTNINLGTTPSSY